MNYQLTPIAHIETDFPTKFGVPRQSGLVKGLKGRIVFEPDYREPEALRGLEGFSHIWLLWDFSEARKTFSFRPTVRPPRLGGNRRVGVFATRSPFRPNNIGLSSVRILSIDLHTSDGPVIEVEGADLMDGTPIFDIKPYLPFTDCHPDAWGSLTPDLSPADEARTVRFSDELLSAYDAEHIDALRQVLLSDPRPHYHDDEERVYGFEFAGREVKFRMAKDVVEAWIEHT
ncbi:MAG: tRNA (N6-threonylcarbamoyladenosine(37)-N6)-methyltransferase TrmO [Bacteroidaceae bacterium]|nr:tRNA (N6-threonylcarbamoyladenosine(37)-N6)-methyltransferase TrmO [Bacteroidaceae bacterium]MBQ9170974.1 tRNA (N6-threonylcarbamoyladenosine(37)-N6)-methyltransferase TrmO [Bacteroidaceae bacterium]MBQ9293962.1 tRNA (N6-threonylcarbamoyladenosine(37)-N6)-methyltransferase TrmO [Bacteroidaceae bacterium]